MTRENVPVGAAFFPVSTPVETRSFQFLLLPEFTLSAFSSAVDTLRIANQLSQQPLFAWTVLSENGRAVAASCGVEVAASGSLGDRSKSDYIIICSGNNGAAAASDKTITEIRKHARFGGKYGSVCTGATTLARAGLLNNRRFTLHWENQPAFREMFPNLDPSLNNFEVDDDLITSGGGAAAGDMMIDFIEKSFGQYFAHMVADMSLRGAGKPQGQPQRSSVALSLSTRNQRLIDIVMAMQENIETPYSIDDLAEMTGYSRRQIERQFQIHMNSTPYAFYKNLRLDRARSLMVETNLSVSEIAAATGFVSPSHFSQLFKQRFGSSPAKLRPR
ncbi:GlxA family transcriptional regulator [Aliiroseovarius sp. YM-037]|uniref:GlxA family transcriptional regulator n=1 Tax=Aliiroseovarius sp. YM-037 TaxID=3341728 RepID=UPI003A8116ED